MRAGDLQSTGNAGPQTGLTAGTASDLTIVHEFLTDPGPGGAVTATPVVSDGLLMMGDWNGRFYVIDLETRRRLVVVETGANSRVSFWSWTGMVATPVVATVTSENRGEERRVYFGVNSGAKTLWCLDLSAILADRETLDDDRTDRYLCEGADWPRSLRAPGSLNDPVFGPTDEHFLGSPIFAAGQRVRVGNGFEARDVLFTPTTGGDCADGQLWALDARSGEILWTWDPVVNGDGQGGVIWTKPAMNREQDLVYVTTGDCVQKPQAGEMAESLVALHADTGKVAWFHQRRLVDAEDFDIGNGPTVVDVEGEDGCRLVLSPDKDGCLYAFRQAPDVPGIEENGLDSLRPGQQRLLWRRCFVPGSLSGGFNAMNAALDGRTLVLHAARQANHAGTDDANAFAVDACTGELRWASSSISPGNQDAAVASGLYFQLGGSPSGPTDLQVVRIDSGGSPAPEVVATLVLPEGVVSRGGGGLAIADGALYVPTTRGVALVEVVPGSGGASPVARGSNRFAGPYAAPIPGGIVWGPIYDTIPD